jgi:hypothetical protein
MAKEGDQRAAELILSRCWPARKSRPINLDLLPVKVIGRMARCRSWTFLEVGVCSGICARDPRGNRPPSDSGP